MKENKPAKILVVVESIDLEDSSGSKANVALIRNLKKAGFLLRVYHYSRKQIELCGVECISIKERRRNLIFLLSRVERYIRKYLKINLNKHIENIFGFSFTLLNDRNSIIAGIIKNDFDADLILTLSKGGSFRPHHALLKMPELHDKWMAYMHDPYPMHVFPPPYTYSEPGWKHKIAFVQNVFNCAEYVAFPSKLLMEWMQDHFKYNHTKSLIIPHQLYFSGTKNVSIPTFFNSLNFNLLHAGNLLWGRDPKGLIEGFKAFLIKCPEAKAHARLIFIGGKNYYSGYLKTTSINNKEIEVVENYLAFDKVNELQKKAAVNIILEAKAAVSPFLPGKFPHCISANRPILLLGPAKSECKRLLGDSYPNWAEIDAVENIKGIIENLYRAWKEKGSPNLDRPDLKNYMSEKSLKEILDPIFKKS